MYGYAHAGAMLRAFRKDEKLSQKALAAKTQIADAHGVGISESILSQIENGKRDLSPYYWNLIEAADIFSFQQLKQLQEQAIADMICHQFGRSISAITLSFLNEGSDEPSGL